MYTLFYRAYDRILTKLDPYLSKIAITLLGTTMILYGIIVAMDIYDESVTIFQHLRTIGAAGLVIAGASILVDRRSSRLKACVIFATSLGFLRTMIYFYDMKDAIMDATQSGGVWIFYLWAVLYAINFILSLRLFITAAAIAFGFSFRRNSLITICVFVMLTDLLLVIMFNNYEDYFDWNMTETYVSTIMFITVLWIFDSEEVRYKSTWGKHALFMQDVRDQTVYDKAAYILPSEAEVLMDMNHERWKVLPEGPAEKEFEFWIYGRYNNSSRVIAQIWKTDSCIHLTISGSAMISIIYAKRLIVESMYMKEGKLHMSNRDGLDMAVAVREKTVLDIYPGMEALNDQ